MDWIKLIGFAGILFMLLEVISAKLAALKKWMLRTIIFVVMAGASLGLAIAAPVVLGIKAQVLLNALAYFVTEYFLFLVLRNELNLSLKNFILSKFGGASPPVAPTIEDRR